MRTAAQHRADAAASLAAERESFQRCDTDGSISQWSHGINARLSRERAAIVEDGNTSTFIGLYEGARRVAAREITTRFGTSWLLDEERERDLIARRGKVFLPTGKRSRVLRNLGLAERAERAPAWCCFADSGGGVASVYVKIFRTGDKWGDDATLVQ